MQQGQFKSTRRSVQQLLAFPIAVAMLLTAARADPPGQFGVLLAPAFMDYENARPVAGAKATVLVPARREEFALRYFTKERWAAENLDWESAWPKAMETADGLVEKLKVRWFTDANDVSIYAAIEAEDEPFLSGMFFSKKFFPLFEERLGAQILVLVPDRSTIYVFPKHGGKLGEYAPGIAGRYRDAVSKVSLEIFEVSESGCRVIGSIGS